VGASRFHLHDVANHCSVCFISWADENNWEAVFDEALLGHVCFHPLETQWLEYRRFPFSLSLPSKAVAVLIPLPKKKNTFAILVFSSQSP